MGIDELVDTSKESPRNIPTAKFIEKVEVFVGDRPVEGIMQNIEELLSKYKYMERSMVAQMQAVKNKIPDILLALQSVRKLKEPTAKDSSDGEDCYFCLAETVYAKATITPTDKVFVWLGANTMMEYSLDEAEELLDRKYNASQEIVGRTSKELEWLWTQITTTEVNIARVHNFAVQKRKEAQLKPFEETKAAAAIS